ncbi:MAG: hypothetical protein JJU15_17745 [Pararhodobacter sp.]|nr:hypothetical protein [Pararhodobacter sp.]
MDALFIAELNERLFTHFTRGAWHAPYSQRLLPVGLDPDQPLGRIACADARDLERAFAHLCRAGAAPAPEALASEALAVALHAQAQAITLLRAREGFADAPGPLDPVVLPSAGPMVLLSAASMPVAGLTPLLIAGAQHGMLWKPAPGAAASAHLIMRLLGPLAGGRLAMVQGDHETGAALARMGPLVWASAAPLPPGLPAPVWTPASGACQAERSAAP